MPEAMAMYGLTDLQEFWEPERDSRVLLAWSPTTVVLSFRGTVSLKNAKTSARVSKISSESATRIVCAHVIAL